MATPTTPSGGLGRRHLGATSTPSSSSWMRLTTLANQFGVVTNYMSPNAGTKPRCWRARLHHHQLGRLRAFLQLGLHDSGPILELLNTPEQNLTMDARYLTRADNLTWASFCNQIVFLPPSYRPTSIFLDCPNLVATLLTRAPVGKSSD